MTPSAASILAKFCIARTRNWASLHGRRRNYGIVLASGIFPSDRPLDGTGRRERFEWQRVVVGEEIEREPE
eukprot:4559032-Lingulodinium_polyedra.AAC.1